MTAPSHLDWLAGRPAGRRRLRRLSARFAEVGVDIPPHRLAAIADGAPAADQELFDIAFAFAATRMRGEDRSARRKGAGRRISRWAIVGAAVVVALNLLLCLGLVFFMLAAHTSPYGG